MERRAPNEPIGVTRYRLRLPANEALDDALIRFTAPEYREKLAPYLSFLSLRYLGVDHGDTENDGVTERRLHRLTAQVNNYRGITQYFSTDKIFWYRAQKTPDNHINTVSHIDIVVHFGQQALAGFLWPDLYLRSEAERRAARNANKPFDIHTVPQDELTTGNVRMRYIVRAPDSQPSEALRNLRQVMEEGVALQDLAVVDETQPLIPFPSIQPKPMRNPALFSTELNEAS